MSKRPGILQRLGAGFDRLVSVYDPVHAVERHRARQVFNYYEAARPSQYRKQRRETGSANTAVNRAGVNLREQARHAEQNHDIARNALAILVQNTIGPHGIGVEPQPRRRDGTIHQEFARQIREARRDWVRRPEVTWSHDWPSAERILARSWFRDGEVFAQHVEGNSRAVSHGTRVPYSLELLEADFVPFDYSRDNVVQGVQLNEWRRPVAFHVYRSHPADYLFRVATRQSLKTVPAARMLHCKLIDRIGQVRGVSVFASVLARLEDIKDYEESERIAAKVAASMAAYIKKGMPEMYDLETDADGDPEPRNLKFSPGMVFDDLGPGEEIGTIDTKRPNTSLEPHRNGQLRAAAGGFGVTYSSLSKNYDGTYSAQRQELVEGHGGYQLLASEFIHQVSRPVYQRFLNLAILSGQITVPADVDPSTLDDALFIAPQMPWIDPAKEANSWVTLESAGYASAPEIIRRRGQNPNDVLEQEASWQQQVREKGMTFEPIQSPEDTADAEQTNRGGTNARFRA